MIASTRLIVSNRLAEKAEIDAEPVVWPASDDRLRLSTFCLEITDYSGRVHLS
jgi:hypothetical protein